MLKSPDTLTTRRLEKRIRNQTATLRVAGNESTGFRLVAVLPDKIAVAFGPVHDKQGIAVAFGQKYGQKASKIVGASLLRNKPYAMPAPVPAIPAPSTTLRRRAA